MGTVHLPRKSAPKLDLALVTEDPNQVCASSESLCLAVRGYFGAIVNEI